MQAMKVFVTLVLALSVLQGTSAFVPKVPQSSKVTSLKSTYLPTTNGRRVNGRRNGRPYRDIPIQSESVIPPLAIDRDIYPRRRNNYGGLTRYRERTPYNRSRNGGRLREVDRIWDMADPVRVEGGSLRTWSFATPVIDRVQVLMRSEGRPIHANVDLWQGPDNSPMQMKVYIENGELRPFNAIIETPGEQNSIAIRNTGQMEFPMAACLEADLDYHQRHGGPGLEEIVERLAYSSRPVTVQGGAVRTYPFDPSVGSVQIMLRTDGRPLNARIEMLQGPNNNKQVIDLYVEDGRVRPFVAIIETPGTGNVVRIVNTATVEFPMFASVEPYMMKSGRDDADWDGGDHFVMDRQW